ncbi:MAG: TonB-dependent receptor [Pseudomonadales bacterium]|nr:TonB-dependent receptor [Pseudomonadales bacterium]
MAVFLVFSCPSLADDELEGIYDLSLEQLLNVKITVASLFEDSALFVASSASKVSEEEWRRQGAEKTYDAIEHVPGVYTAEFVHGQTVPVFRGYGGVEHVNSFLVLLDGIPLNNYSSSSANYGVPNYALGNLSSIEVIRGPGSALYGADAFYGVVSLNTWQAQKNTLQTWAELGSFGHKNANIRAHYNFSEHVGLSSQVYIARTDDEKLFHDFHQTGGNGIIMEDELQHDYKNITTTHKLQIYDAQLAYYYSSHEVEDSFGLSEFSAVPNGTHSNGDASFQALKLSHELNLTPRWSLESQLFYSQDQQVGLYGLLTPGEIPTEPGLTWDSKDSKTGASVMFKKHLNDEQWQGVFGFSVDKSVVDHFGAVFTGSPLDVNNKSRETAALIGQVDWRLFDEALQIIIGGRYDNYSDFGHYVSPRLGVIYHPQSQSAIKLLYGNAFRAPSVNEQVNNGLVQGGGDDLQPEEVDTYELIWMQETQKYNVSVNIYYSQTAELISFTPDADPGFAARYINQGEAESYGLEIAGRYQLGKWDVYGNYGYNQSQLNTPVKIEDAYPAFPDHIINAGLNYAVSPTVMLSANQVLQKGRQTDDGHVVSFKNEDLSLLSRTDVHLAWLFQAQRYNTSVYFIVLDIFDRQDTKSSLMEIERGNATPGRYLKVGVELSMP